MEILNSIAKESITLAAFIAAILLIKAVTQLIKVLKNGVSEKLTSISINTEFMARSDERQEGHLENLTSEVQTNNNLIDKVHDDLNGVKEILVTTKELLIKHNDRQVTKDDFDKFKKDLDK